jgi:hypothetical protein
MSKRRRPVRSEASGAPGSPPPSELAGVQGSPPSKMERETGIEPATNSLEGCDSTTELLPPSLPLASLATPAGEPACDAPTFARNFGGRARLRPHPHSPIFCSSFRPAVLRLCPYWPVNRSGERSERFAKVGGEGRTRTFEAARATDLQSAAFDRFATSPYFRQTENSDLIAQTC